MIVLLLVLFTVSMVGTRLALAPLERRWVAFWFDRWERQGKL